jgi:hypothetical protein
MKWAGGKASKTCHILLKASEVLVSVNRYWPAARTYRVQL